MHRLLVDPIATYLWLSAQYISALLSTVPDSTPGVQARHIHSFTAPGRLLCGTGPLENGVVTVSSEAHASVMHACVFDADHLDVCIRDVVCPHACVPSGF